MPKAPLEHVTEAEPVLGDESSEAFERAIVRIEHQLRQGAQLTGPVPPIRAMHHDTLLPDNHLIKDIIGRTQALLKFLSPRSFAQLFLEFDVLFLTNLIIESV